MNIISTSTVFSLLRKLGLLINVMTQLLCIAIYSYYMVNAEKYQVTWSLFVSILPMHWITFLNTALGNLGAYILLIPTAIIIASWILYKDMWLKILAAICCGMGVILVGYNIYTTGMLIPEYVNLRLIKVTQILSIEEKQALFINLYSNLIQTQLGLLGEQKALWLRDYMSLHANTIYLDRLIPMDKSQIITYAQTVFMDLSAQYDIKLKEKGSTWLTWDTAIKVGIVCLVIIGVLIIAWSSFKIRREQHATSRVETTDDATVADLRAEVEANVEAIDELRATVNSGIDTIEEMGSTIRMMTGADEGQLHLIGKLESEVTALKKINATQALFLRKIMIFITGKKDAKSFDDLVPFLEIP